jgi:outer membrane biosynthesis protein TonB
VRRFATIALSLCLTLTFALAGANRLAAQDEPKKEEAPKTEAPKAEAPKAEAPKADASAEVAPTIPPEVEAKLEAARRAVAEAIVAAQDAGLVKTSIDPPPILDILITGRANDEATLKAKTGVSPEVFGAWFAGQGTVADINPQKDVRIVPPGGGLRQLYDLRKEILGRHIAAVRKDKPAPKKEEAKPEPAKEEPKEPKKEEAKPEPAKEEPKEPKKEEETKKADDAPAAPKDEAKKDDKKDEAGKAEAPK